MKALVKFILPALILVSGALFVGCNSSSPEKETVQKEAVTPNATLVVNVEGMTCEKGCASAIEKAFTKAEGVSDCDVDFDEKMATINYDNTQVSEEELLGLFPEIGSGDYTAVKSM